MFQDEYQMLPKIRLTSSTFIGLGWGDPASIHTSSTLLGPKQRILSKDLLAKDVFPYTLRIITCLTI